MKTITTQASMKAYLVCQQQLSHLHQVFAREHKANIVPDAREKPERKFCP